MLEEEKRLGLELGSEFRVEVEVAVSFRVLTAKRNELGGLGLLADVSHEVQGEFL